MHGGLLTLWMLTSSECGGAHVAHVPWLLSLSLACAGDEESGRSPATQALVQCGKAHQGVVGWEEGQQAAGSSRWWQQTAAMS